MFLWPHKTKDTVSLMTHNFCKFYARKMFVCSTGQEVEGGVIERVEQGLTFSKMLSETTDCVMWCYREQQDL